MAHVSPGLFNNSGAVAPAIGSSSSSSSSSALSTAAFLAAATASAFKGRSAIGVGWTSRSPVVSMIVFSFVVSTSGMGLGCEGCVEVVVVRAICDTDELGRS
jgi:hypothetical protein